MKQDDDHVDQRKVSALFRTFARQLQAMDPADFQRLMNGAKFEIRLSGSRSPNNRRRVSDPSLEDLEALCAKLQEIVTREAARELIDGVLKTRSDLIAFAKHLGIPAPKNTNSDGLRDRLVEATVGFRVRAAAVRGTLAGDTSANASKRRLRVQAIGHPWHWVHSVDAGCSLEDFAKQLERSSRPEAESPFRLDVYGDLPKTKGGRTASHRLVTVRADSPDDLLSALKKVVGDPINA